MGGGLTDSGMRDAAATSPSTTRARSRGVGDRVRALRVAAGLTQTELAGARFSKEYVSQIERGKTRPTADTLAWLAERLGVDAQYLEHGVSADVRNRVETRLARAEALSEAHRDQEAVDAFREAREEIGALGSPELELRALAGEGWALQELGDTRAAIEALQSALALVELPPFSDVDRADVLFRLGCCRYRLSSIPTAIALLDQALDLAERSGMPCDLLRARILALALALPPAAGRLRGCARGRRAGARARAGDGRPAGRRRCVLPGLVGRREDGALGARRGSTRSRPRRSTRSSTTRGTPDA